MPGPGFTPQQQEVIDKIDENQANGVEEPLLSASENFDFTLQRLKRYLRELLEAHRSALGSQIEIMYVSGAHMEQMGSISPAMGAKLDSIISASGTPLDAANRQFSNQMQNLFGANDQNLFSSDPFVRDVQNQLLSGTNKPFLDSADEKTLGQKVFDSRPPPPPTYTRVMDPLIEMRVEAREIAEHLEQQVERRMRENPGTDPERSKAIKENVMAQVSAVATALALSPNEYNSKPGDRTQGGDLVNQCLDHMFQKAEAEVSYKATPGSNSQAALNNISTSVKQFDAAHQTNNQQFSNGMQNLFESSDQNLFSSDPFVRDVQNQLLSGTNKPFLDPASEKKLGQQVFDSRPPPKPGYTRKMDPLLEMRVEALEITEHLKQQVERRMGESPNGGLDQRSMAIKEKVMAQVSAVATALALSPNEYDSKPGDRTQGGDLVNQCLDHMFQKAEQDYKAEQNCLRNMPADSSALNELHKADNPAQTMNTAQQTYTQLNGTLEVLGVSPAPMPQAQSARATQAPRPN